MTDAFSEIFGGPVESPDRFDDFWKAWPDHHRKVAKAQCKAKWQRKRLDSIADLIIAHVQKMKNTDDWVKGFIPLPATYLNQARWEANVHSNTEPLPGNPSIKETQEWIASHCAPIQTTEEARAKVRGMLLAAKQKLARSE